MSTGLSSPELVGRETQMERLSRVLDAAEESCPTLTLVVGEAGVGKTRLARQLAEHAADRGMLVLRGECIALSGGEFPYAPIAAALRDAAPAAIDAALTQLPARARSELARVFPDIVRDPRTPDVDDEQIAQSRLFAWLLSLFRQLAESVPILLVVEDLQSADASSRDFLLFLAQSMRSERVGVTVTVRNDELHRDHPVRRLVAELTRSDKVDRMDVPPLSVQAVERQIAGIQGTRPSHDLVTRLFARSEGNPFYTEELLAADQAATETVSATLRDALLLRVESRSATAQAIARLVSAVSRPAGHALIQAAIGLPERDVQLALRECVDHQLLVCERQTGCYRFRHTLLREAVYDDLLPLERTRLHRSIAQLLEEARKPVSSAECAYHWDAAGEPERALPALIEAGLAAERVFAYGEALEHFGRALELWETEQPLGEGAAVDLVGLLARAAEAARWTGDFARAKQLCEQALATFDHDTDPTRAAGLYERLGRYQPWNVEGSLAAYQQAIILLSAEDAAERVRLRVNQAYALTFVGRWEEAKAKADDALQNAVDQHLLAEEGSARAVLGVAVAFLGDLPAGERHLRHALQLAEQTGNVQDVAQIHLDLGEVLRLQGRVPDALQVMLDGERVAARHGADGSYGNFMAVSAADDLLRLGRWDEAEARLTELAGSELGPTAELFRATVAGRLDTACGRLEAAAAQFEHAVEVSHEAALLEFIPTLHAAYAELELWRHATDRARAQIAGGLRSIGDGEDALHLPALYSMGARVEADLAEQARACADNSEADRAYQAAATHCERLGALLAARHSGARPPEAEAHLANCEAELTRAAGQSSSERWVRVVELWSGLDRSYATAYGAYRHAEALIADGQDRPQAQEALTEAARLIAGLSAGPLNAEIYALARAARLTVSTEERSPDAPLAPAAERGSVLDLTDRELQVLALIGAGLTNREIAHKLYISQKTAGVHVSHILSKLRVPNRVMAATIAQRLGVVPPG